MEAEPLGRRERKKRALRAKIVTDCCTLIADIGVEGATLETLCDRVDISKKTFYNYFGSKDSLLLEICHSHLMTGMESTIDLALASEANCGDQIDKIFNTLFEGRDGTDRFDLELIDYLVSNFGRNRGASVGLLDEMNRHFVRFFEHHSDALLPDLKPVFCGEMTVGMLNSVILNWMNHPQTAATEKIPEVCAFIKRSMLVEASA